MKSTASICKTLCLAAVMSYGPSLLAQHNSSSPQPLSILESGSTTLSNDGLIPGIPMPVLAGQIYADFVMSGFPNTYQLSGEGVTVNYFESQIRCDHVDLVGKVVAGCYQGQTGSGSCNHSTSGVGKIAASGVVPESRGLAPGVKIRAGSCGIRDSDTDALCTASAALYGGGTGIWKTTSVCPADVTLDPNITIVRKGQEQFNGRYVPVLDSYITDNPNYAMVLAAGNGSGNNKNPELSTYPSRAELQAGHYHEDCETIYYDLHSPTRDHPYDALASGASSKNVIAVADATVFTERYERPSDVRISGHSSRGPTDDGRIKPDISAPVYNGDLLAYSSLACGSETSYTPYFGGTSAAAPVVSGVYALLHEMQSSNYSDKFLSSTYRSLLLHTAFEVGPHDGPDYDSGWGLINAYGAVSLMGIDANNPGSFILESELDASQSSYTSSIVGVAGQPVKISLAWTDPAGLACSDDECTGSTLVNDLELVVKDSQGNRYYPWTLNPDSPTEPASQNEVNSADNYEQVKIKNPVQGELYTIEVTWANQALANAEQTFSVVKSNWGVDQAPVESSLDVEFKSFDLLNQSQKVHLSWETSSETNNSHFIVERRWKNEIFKEIGRVEGAGNSRTEISYQFLDDLSEIGTDTVQYRLRQIDFDGSFTFSSILETAFGHFTTPVLHQNYPNPFVGSTELAFSLNLGGEIKLEIFDTSGRVVKTLLDGYRKGGRHSLTFESGDLAPGVYFAVLNTSGHTAKQVLTIK